MYRSLLSALLLGLFSSQNGVSTDTAALRAMAITPPARQMHITDHLSASGVVIEDLGSGQEVFAKDARVQRPMASLTKLMTAVLIVEHHDVGEVVTVPQAAANVAGNKVYLPPGEQFTVGDLLSALLINSANDAAVTLAIYDGGSVDAFVRKMNRRALELGMTATSFRNPVGLDNPAHWSTPQDIAWLTTFALRYPAIAKRLGTPGTRITSLEGSVVQLYHTHELMHEAGPVLAGKTGTTDDAGQCLMSIVRGPDNHKYVVVLLGSDQRYKDMKSILAALESSQPIAVRK